MSRNHEMDDDDDDDDDEEEEEEEDSNHQVQEAARWSASDLVVRALRALDTCEPELASKFFERALALEPNNVDILDEFAELLLSQGDVARASRLLQQSTKVRRVDRS
jgi:Tfp pilus assembly protein PilF